MPHRTKPLLSRIPWERMRDGVSPLPRGREPHDRGSGSRHGNRCLGRCVGRPGRPPATAARPARTSRAGRECAPGPSPHAVKLYP